MLFVSDSNKIRTSNHLVLKRTLNHLAKLVKWLKSVCTTPYAICIPQMCFQRKHLYIHLTNPMEFTHGEALKKSDE